MAKKKSKKKKIKKALRKKKENKKKEQKKKQDKKKNSRKKKKEAKAITVNTSKTKKQDTNDHSSNYNVKLAVKKLRSLKTTSELKTFTKGEKRITIVKAIPAAINRATS